MAQQAQEPVTPRSRQESQIQLILDAFGDEVDVHPPDWRESEEPVFLYRRGSVLCRDSDLPRVRELFPDDDPRGIHGDAINGLTRYVPPYRFPDDYRPPEGISPTQQLLAYIDARLGAGVCTPDHLVYVCPVSPCPATEPESVGPWAEPEPGVSTECCDGRGVKVSVVDVAWADAPNAPWLDGVTGDAATPYGTDGTILPYAGHGTFIAGVIRCIAPRTEVYVEGVFTRAGATFESDLVRQLDEALLKNPDIISLSAGTPTRNDLSLMGFDVFFEERLSKRKGLLLVAAAGNDGVRKPFYPAASPGTVSVGALAPSGRARAGFSNYGGWVDVYAPGQDLVNAYLNGVFICREHPYIGERREFAGMARWSGTSFATPLVTGLIAARMSVTGENAREAARSLLRLAHRRAVPGVGAVLLPEDACADVGECCEDRCAAGGAYSVG